MLLILIPMLRSLCMLPLCALMISDVGDVPVGAAAAPANDGASDVAISVQSLELGVAGREKAMLA